MTRIIDKIRAGEFCLIAEVGVNYYDIAAQRHITNMEAAKLMCYEAMAAGCHAVKFQTYKAGTIASKDSPSYWDTSEEATTSQYELFSKFDSFGEAEYREIADYCEQIGIEFLSTAFDYASADYLDSMMGVYKVSSSDLTNIPFIVHQAKFGKPMLVSVGAGNESEIRRAVEAIREVNDCELVLLHCVLEYPTPRDHANLNRIKTLESLVRDYEKVSVGYSDHCKPDPSASVIVAAYALGATVVEKHFTLDKTLAGNDHYHAMDPQDVRNIISQVELIAPLLGDGRLQYLDTENAARANARRSIVANTDIVAGQKVSTDMLTFKRPGTGISPTDIEELIGRTAKADIPDDTILQWDMFE